MHSLKNKFFILLVNIFLAQFAFSEIFAAPITQVVLSPAVKITPMNIPGMSDDYWVWSVGSYAYAIDDGSMISFFNGAQWSQAKKMVDQPASFAVSYPETAKKSDAWMLLDNNDVYHIDGDQWSTPTPASKILHIDPSDGDIDLETSGGYVFLVGQNNDEQSNTSTLAFAVWSPKTRQWLSPTILKGFSMDLEASSNMIVAYDSQSPSAVLLVYSGLQSSNPQTHILQIEANGTYTQKKSELLPTYNEMQNNAVFAFDKKGVYMVSPSPTHKLYLWYNHSSTASGWHSIQLLANPLFPNEGLFSNSVHGGTVCEQTEHAYSIGLSCINTLLNHPYWSGPVSVADGLGAIEYYISTKSSGAWVSLLSDVNPSGKRLPYVLRYDTATETTNDTNLELVANEPSMPVLKELSDKKFVVCVPNKGSHDKLYSYNSGSWQHLPDDKVNVHGCLLSASDHFGNELDNGQVFWITDDNDSSAKKKNFTLMRKH